MRKGDYPLKDDEQFIVDGCDSATDCSLQEALEQMRPNERTQLFRHAANQEILLHNITRIVGDNIDIFRIRARNALKMREKR